MTSVIFDDSATTGVTTDSDPCIVTMNFKHDAGCPILDLYRIKLVFMENEWLIGIVLVMSGLFIGLFGLRFMRFTAAILAGVAIFVITVLLCSVFGFTTTVLGIVLTLVTAVAFGIITGLITLIAVWIAIGCLGALGGYFLGLVIYEVALMPADFSHAWAFMILTVSGVILGLFLSIKYGKEVILASTSLIGGYSVM